MFLDDEWRVELQRMECLLMTLLISSTTKSHTFVKSHYLSYCSDNKVQIKMRERNLFSDQVNSLKIEDQLFSKRLNKTVNSSLKPNNTKSIKWIHPCFWNKRKSNQPKLVWPVIDTAFPLKNTSLTQPNLLSSTLLNNEKKYSPSNAKI